MGLFEYSKWDGSQAFSPQSADALFEQLSEYMMQYGDAVLKDLDEDQADLVELLQKEGYVEKDAEGRYRVTPKGTRKVQERALQGLFQGFKRDATGKHDAQAKGPGTVRHEDTRPYQYGDPLANLDLSATLKNALVRQGEGTPIKVTRDDWVVYETEYQTSCATVVLIDMSGSMGRFGKYAQTKRIALALQALVRAQYPQDSLQMVGFYTYASVLGEKDLINSAPKPVSIYNPKVHLRINLDSPPAFVPQHFTNIHAGLKMARTLLGRQAAANKQIIVITDGEPTAHLEGRDLLLIYPPCEKTATLTLGEAKRCALAGIKVSSFALIEDYYYLGLVNFVEDLARVTKGVAAYCSADDIGKYVFDSFMDGRRTRRAFS